MKLPWDKPPRRRGPGKKTLAKLNGQPEIIDISNTDKKALTVSPRAIAASSFRRDYKEVVGIGGINSDWALSGISEDSDVWQNIFGLRSRSRDLFRTNPYFKKYKEELWANVFGAEGITCRMRVKETEDRVVYASAEKQFVRNYAKKRERLGQYLERKFGTPNRFDLQGIDTRQSATIQVGDLDMYANKVIEDGWARWQRREFCTMSGCLNYNEVRQIRLLSCARDGDYFLRHIRSPSANEYGYSLQLINAEWCDYYLNTKLDNGNEIRMGIERNKWGKRIAYWFITRSPMDWQFSTPGFGMTAGGGKAYTVIPAEEIIHYARYEDGDSTRPAPWSASVLQTSRHLGKYEEAEVVAARVSACKLGFFTSNQVPEGGEAMGDRPDPTQEATMDAEPGSFTGLKWGIDFKEWNPEHPNGNFDLFRKGMLRSWCAGMPGANYNIIANDLEGVNYSSGRLGMLDERELWKLIQKFDIEIAERPIFENWLEMSLMTGAIKLPLAKFDKFNKPIFRGRRWAWVDPMKEVQANALQVANKFISRTRVIEDSDVDADFEEVLFELAEEEMLMEELGMDSTPAVGKVTPERPTTPADEGEPTDATPAEQQTAKALAIAFKDNGEKQMTPTQLLLLMRALAPQPPPPTTVSVNVPPIEIPPPNITISSLAIPEQKAPVVHVAAAKVTIPEIRMPEIKIPDVIVNIDPTPVTVINKVEIPTTKKVKVKRDDTGKISEMTTEKE